MNRSLWIIIFLSLWNSALLAAPVFSAKPSLELDPFIMHQSGTYKIGHDDDKGDYSALGFGFRFGLRMPLLFLGAEMAVPYVMTVKSTEDVDATFRSTNPLFKNQEIIAYGATASLALSFLTADYTYYFDLKYKDKIEDSATDDTATYEYSGTGYKYGAGLELFEGLIIGVHAFKYRFNEYSLSSAVNGLTKTEDAGRNMLTIEGYQFGLSYKFFFDDIASMGKRGSKK